jgi:hypothetical protein
MTKVDDAPLPRNTPFSCRSFRAGALKAHQMQRSAKRSRGELRTYVSASDVDAPMIIDPDFRRGGD